MGTLVSIALGGLLHSVAHSVFPLPHWLLLPFSFLNLSPADIYVPEPPQALSLNIFSPVPHSYSGHFELLKLTRRVILLKTLD